MSGPLKVAVLDDYQGFAEPIFQKLDSSKFQVAIFNDTLRPYNHPGTSQDEKEKLVKRLEPFNIICTMRERTPFPKDLITRLPNLKLLLTTGLRNHALDLPTFSERGIPVAGAKSSGDSTVHHCVAMILALARNIIPDDQSVKSGGWQTGVAVNLTGATLGVVGLGRLGLALAKIMHSAFGLKVIAWSPNLTQEKADEQAREVGLALETDGEKTFKVVSKEELFRESDVLSVHVVLSDRSRGMIGKKELELMKPDAIFVNTSRGPIVVDEDLQDVLNKGKIRSAALDVFELEPLPLDSRWRTTKWGEDGRSQVLLTPHTGYAEKEKLTTWYEEQVANILKWEKGDVLVNIMA
ncbi:D-3-phosphoglycerate dehydrogenase [Cytospora mali]|uniref:D-3-phosphoglycerate dehydrogenase n=1 Tax=Cytospora mali TaxID=578113 RepID=A0A194VFB8_CYTMA|nr:D-3-phosphoglycerate dehydrogenase [Valsa mali var. pyri (nom. inval.)]